MYFILFNRNRIYFHKPGRPLFVSLHYSFIRICSFLLFLLFTLFDIYFHTKKIKIIINCLVILLTFSLWIYYPAAIIISAILEFENPITDVKAYNVKLRGSWFSNIFPKEIPSTAENISFRFAPGFLQAGTEVSLYYVDNSINIETFKSTYQEKAKWSGYRWQNNPQKISLVGAFSNTPLEYQRGADFYLYLIEGKCDDSGYCNHGEYLFVAINENTKEIVYKGAYW